MRAADAAAEEQPETVEPETNEATAQEPEVRAPIDELPGAGSARGDGRIAYVHDQHQLRDDS